MDRNDELWLPDGRVLPYRRADDAPPRRPAPRPPVRRATPSGGGRRRAPRGTADRGRHLDLVV